MKQVMGALLALLVLFLYSLVRLRALESTVLPSSSTSTTELRGGAGRRHRMLVVVTGSLRCGEPAWESLHQHLLEANRGWSDVDLALLVETPVPARYENASLFRRATYVWTVETYPDWTAALDLVANNTTDWREPFFSLWNAQSSHNIAFGPLQHSAGHGAIVFFFRWALAQKIRELKLDEIYDQFVVTRSDHFYQCDQLLHHMDPQYVWVIEGQDYGGINDRHYVASNKDILKSLNVLPPILENPEVYADWLKAKYMNSEMILGRRFEEEGLQMRRFPRNIFVCAAEEEPKRSGLAKKYNHTVTPDGVQRHIKYTSEYCDAQKTCRPRRATIRWPIFWKQKTCEAILEKFATSND